jgi:hypothetical protein
LGPTWQQRSERQAAAKQSRASQKLATIKVRHVQILDSEQRPTL